MRGDDIIAMLAEKLSRLEREEQTALTVGFFRDRDKVAREFIRYCASCVAEHGQRNPGWRDILDTLDRVESRERSEHERERMEAFLGELEAFRDDCLAGKCVECADFEDKRRAYADGDVYFEDFIYGFIDDHGGIQAFIRYAKEADRYYRRGDHATAGGAYGMLLDIYRHDTGVEHLLVVDDDFPDLDLSQVEGVDAAKLMERRDACREAMRSGKESHEADGRTRDGGG